MRKPFKILAVVFILVGLIPMIVAGVWAGSLLSFRQGALMAEGEIWGLPFESYRDGYVISFTDADGEQHTVRPGYNSSEFFPGKRMTIYYHMEDPTKIQAANLIWFTAIPGGIGLIFLLIGIGFLIPLLFIGRRKKRLMENGRRIFAEIETVGVNFMMRINYAYPYRIICSHTDSYGVRHLFRSENLWYNPDYILQKRNITKLPVYVDGDNYRRYYVDVSELDITQN